MKFLLVAALGLGLSATCYQAAAQDAPRELGGPPVLPAPAPRQLVTVPVAPVVADSARPAPGPVPAVAGALPTSAARPGDRVDGPGLARPGLYQVGLKSGAVYSVHDVNVKSPLFGRSYLQLDGRQRVELSEVRFYEDQTGHYVRSALPGSARETTLRREKTGRISLYATYTTSYSPGGFMPGYGYGGYGGGYRTTKTEYFSKDNGPIQNLSARNLAAATADHPGAQTLLAQARHYRTGIILSYAAAGGLLVAGFSQSVRGATNGISPVYYVAIPALVLPLILQSKQASLQRQAITLYNGEQ